MIDLLSILPHEVSRDLMGYILMFYGPPKSGKTTIATEFPDALLLAFELGYNALPGIFAMPMLKWMHFKEALMQLELPAIKARYKYIIIDTGDIAYKTCKEFIFNKEGAKEYKDIPYGQGYPMVEEEFDKCMRKIVQLGYGLIFLSHDQEKTINADTDEEHVKIMPTLDKRARKVINRMCDIIGYARLITNPENGEEETYLFMRGTSRFEAGSRFKYTSDYILFTYENLVNDINSAIDKLETNDGATIADHRKNVYDDIDEYDVEEEIAIFYQMVEALTEKDADYKIEITDIIEDILGKDRNIGNCTQKQADLVHLINEKVAKL